MSRQTTCRVLPLASLLLLAVAVLLGMIPACTSGPTPLESTGWVRATEYSMTYEQRRRLPDLWAARNAMTWQMDGRLKQLLHRVGPARGMDGYRDEVEAVAGLVEREHAVNVGRVLARSGRAEPQLPAWAESLVAGGSADAVFLTGPEGQVAGLFPVRSSSSCAACHGPTDRLSVDVQEALATRALLKDATGFRGGELIGWYWVVAESEGATATATASR